MKLTSECIFKVHIVHTATKETKWRQGKNKGKSTLYMIICLACNSTCNLCEVSISVNIFMSPFNLSQYFPDSLYN